MTTNTKRATGRHRIRLGTVGRGFSHDHKPPRSAFLPLCLSREPSMPARSGPDTPLLFQPRKHAILFAFLSQETSKTPAAHSTHSDERNTTQLIENTHNRCASLDTLIASRGIVIREGTIPRKRKYVEGNPCPQGRLETSSSVIKSQSAIAPSSQGAFPATLQILDTR
jgi:hypothetical protein